MPAWQVSSAGGFLRREIVARQGCSALRAMGRLVPETRGSFAAEYQMRKNREVQFFDRVSGA